MHLAPAGKMGSCNCGMDSSVWLTWSAGASQKVAQAHSSDIRRRGVDFRRSETVPVVRVRCFAAGQVREIPVQVVRTVYWRKAGPDLPLLLLAIKPLGYRLRKGSKLLYRQPAFLICTDPQLDLTILLQAYVDRWEIECNHRDEKSLIGTAQG